MYNRLLERQIKRHFGKPEDLPLSVVPLLESISRSYDHYESDRVLIERSIDLSSQELMTAYAKLRAETEALTISQERFRLAALSSSNLIYDWNLLTNELVWFGQIDEQLGFEEGEFPHTMGGWERVVHPDDYDRTMEAITEAIASGSSFSADYRVVRKDGSVLHWRDRAAIIRDPATGTALRFIGAVSDMTQEMHSALLIKQSEERFRAVAENLGEGLIISDRNDKVLYVNSRMSELTGYSREEMVGKYAYHLLLEDRFWPFIAKKIEERIEGKSAQYELMLRRKDGSLFWCRINATPLRDPEGNIIGSIGCNTDISDSKLAEEKLREAKEKAEEMNRLKTNFLANMSHEIRTPMTAVLGYSSLIEESAEDPEIRGYAEVIGRSGNRLLNTINQILDLSRIESNQVEVIIEPVSALSEIEKAIETLFPISQQKGLPVEIEADGDLMIDADAQLLGQVLINLVGNAIKYTHVGRVSVRLSKQGESALIEVKDTGIGIGKEFLPHVFDEFKQESAGHGRHFEGTGLGLTITRRLTELMGGAIGVESSIDVGTTFSLTFPLHRIPLMEPADLTSGSEATGRRILIVEDCRDTLKMTRTLLKGEYEVISASNAVEARAVLGARSVDLILMDIHLGQGTNGLELTRELRSQSAFAATPIVALTAYAMKGDREIALNAGCTDYLQKPFSKPQLLDCVASNMRQALPVSA